MPGRYGIRSESEIGKGRASFYVCHKHSVPEIIHFGMPEDHDMLCNMGILDFYVNEGDHLEYHVGFGELPIVKIYLKEAY